MRQFHNAWQTRLLCGLLACGLAVPALGQQQGGDGRERGDRRARQERDTRPQENRRQTDRKQRDRQVRLEPSGWVRVGVDYDQDGRFDAIETIYAFDLETARRESQRRKDRSERARRSGEQQMVQVEGDLRDVRKIRMRDEDANYLVGRVRTDQGRTAKVLLGKEEQLSKLDLSEGDRIGVRGRVGTVNRQAILVASQVRSGDQQVQVQLKKRARGDRPQERMRAEREQLRGSVIRTRSAEFRGHDKTFLVAQLRTRDGDRRLVNMGPKDRFEDVDFGDADVRVLGHPGRISGDEALIAEKVVVDGETIEVKPDERRDQRWRREDDDRERRFRDGDRRLRDREIGDRREGEGRFLDREDRERRLLDREDGERRLRDRAGRVRERDDREGRFLDRSDQTGILRDREGREEREGRLLNRGDRDEREEEEREEEEREQEEREQEEREQEER